MRPDFFTNIYQIMTFKNEKLHGGQNSKERITVILAVNLDGSQKLKPLMIGKFTKPSFFKNILSFPIMYQSNKKVWMTVVLLTQWLLCIGLYMKKENRKILIFVDNYNTHKNIPYLENIKIYFLPSNITLNLQQLDHGKKFKIIF